MQTEKAFNVKRNKLGFLLRYKVEIIDDLRADYRMYSSKDESEKLAIKD